MKKHKILLIFSIFFLTILNLKNVEAYGFGVKKNSENKQPDVGFYKEIIEKNNGLYVGNNDSKIVYLTFDCGYENGYTQQILDTLKEKEVNATFFITGHYLKSATNLVLQMINDGHVIANHSDKHKDITKISEEEIKKDITVLEKDYQDITGKEITKFFRPPAGNFDNRSLDVVNKLGYKTLFWSISYKDWNHKSGVDYAVNEVCSNIHNGAIILLHAVSEDNAKALSIIIDKLEANGYVFESTKNLLN